MAQLKTGANDGDVQSFLAAVPDEARRADAQAVCDLMARASGEAPVMWGASIVGFGTQHLRYDSGRELDWMQIGFSPRKANTTLYLSGALEDYADQLARLGKHTTGKGCLYIKRLADVDTAVLEEIVTASLAHARESGS